jgi:DNA-binding winged helix-turn-helix (wHTH) protein
MSTVWIVAADERQVAELSEFLSGVFAVRRISSLLSLTRLLKLNEARPNERFLCLVFLDIRCGLIEAHSGISTCLHYLKYSEICIVGSLDQDQQKLVQNFGLNHLACFGDHAKFSREIKSMMENQRSAGDVSITDRLIRIGDIEVDRDLALMRILATGLEEALTPKEVRIMQVLTVAANKTISREELIGRVWTGVRVSASTIDSHMSRLRKKIEQSFECRLETEYGSGWKLSVRDQSVIQLAR